MNNQEKEITYIMNNKLDDPNVNLSDKYSKYNNKCFKNNKRLILIGIFVNIIFIFCSIAIIIYNETKKKKLYLELKTYQNDHKNKIDIKNLNKFLINVKKEKIYYKISNKLQESLLKYESQMPHLKELNKKRTFNNLLPLPESIKCNPHFFSTEELLAFMSFLTEDTIYFETGTGCSSIIAKYYAKKTYSIEGSKFWYEKGIKNGLNNSLIFKDLKTDNNQWSVPGSRSNLDDWKNYFQSYQKHYNADVLFIDGRFKIATAMDVFNKINDDTVILIHEYKSRPIYFILEEYYNYIYHWNTIYAFMKKKEIKEIPLEIQEKYWKEFL